MQKGLPRIVVVIQSSQHKASAVTTMGAGTWGAGWATAHPGKNQGGPCPPWKYQQWSENFQATVCE